MKVLIPLGGIVAAFVLLMVTRSLGAEPDDRDALRRAGALLWEMNEMHHEFSDGRIARGVTAEKARRMAESTSSVLARNRDALAALLPKLPAASPFAKNLSAFPAKWPDRAAFLNDLLVPHAGGVSGIDITSLVMQVQDTRRGWKTLSPFFRP